jgi:hypothetical protein
VEGVEPGVVIVELFSQIINDAAPKPEPHHFYYWSHIIQYTAPNSTVGWVNVGTTTKVRWKFNGLHENMYRE